MHMAFRLRKPVIDGQNMPFDLFRQCKSVYKLPDGMHCAVRVFLHMLVHMLGLLLAVHRHSKTRTAHTAFDAVLPRKCHAGQPHGVEFLQYGFRIVCNFQQCSRQHIARSAHGAVKIQCLHPFASIWLIRLARKPAPKPLSIFTTDTPLEQLFSMESSAAMPPKEAP